MTTPVVTGQRSQQEEHTAQTLASLFVAAVFAARAANWLGLAKRWSDRGYDAQSLHKEVSRTFTDVLWNSAAVPLMRAAGLGRGEVLAEYTMELSGKDWNQISNSWAQVYGHEMAKQIAGQSEKAVATLVPQLINRGLRGEALATQVKSLYGLDPRSMNQAITFMGVEKKPRDKTLIDLATKLLSGRAKIIGDVQSFTALNFGKQLTYMEAQDAGLLPKSARKVWVCFAPDSKVIAQNIVQIARRKNTSPMIQLRFASSGSSASTEQYRILTVTPDHLIFTTTHGWVEAKDLQVGTDCLGSANFWQQGVMTPDEQDCPATVAEVFSTAQSMSTTQRKMGMVLNFDSQLNSSWVESEIDVVLVDSVLRNKINTQIAQVLPQRVLGFTDFDFAASLLTECLGDESIIIARSAISDTGLLTSNHGSGPVNSPAILSSLRLGSGSAILQQQRPNGGLRSIEMDSQFTLAESLRMQTYQLTKIDVIPGPSHVYDVTSEQRWVLADGIIAHNCALDERVCPVCRPMDGRTVPLLEQFHIPTKTQGTMKLLMPPVHPSCRCTAVPEDRFKNGLITRTARFFDDQTPKHRGKVTQAIEDLVLSKAEPVEKFNPLQPRNAVGEFAALGAVAAGAKFADSKVKTQPVQSVLPKHLRRVDRKIHRIRNGTYMVPRQYLDFHQRGQSFRFASDAHINDMAKDIRQNGYRMKPVTLHVYDDAVDVADGNHRVEAAYRARLGFVPTKVIRVKGKRPADQGVVNAWRNRRTDTARSQAAARYVVNLDNTKRNPFHGLNDRLIAQDEKNHQWHNKTKPRNIRPL